MHAHPYKSQNTDASKPNPENAMEKTDSVCQGSLKQHHPVTVKT